MAVMTASIMLAGGCRALPDGIPFAGPLRPVAELQLLRDVTYVDASGERHSDREIPDAVLRIVREARQFVLLDFFLFTDLAGAADMAGLQPVTEELTAALLESRARHPDMPIVVVTDPVNTVYGGRRAPHLERLEAAGVQVVITDLRPLRDSNVMYSWFWRLFVQHWGNTENGRTLPNPLGDGRVSARSMLALLNFKANHRKLIVADSGTDVVGLVTSWNPHTASSAHTNVALRFTGDAALDLAASEAPVLAISGGTLPEPLAARCAVVARPALVALGEPSVQVLTEGAIRKGIIEMLDACGPGDRVDLLMFYLSERRVIRALKAAQRRGANVRVLLDPNKDAFGRQKNGIPNRPVARELRRAGVTVRWYATHGEQCHAKMLGIWRADGSTGDLLLGSANFTRRNLNNFNLETNARVRGKADVPVFSDARALFDTLWTNEPDRIHSTDYATYATRSRWKTMLYRSMEATGLSTF